MTTFSADGNETENKLFFFGEQIPLLTGSRAQLNPTIFSPLSPKAGIEPENEQRTARKERKSEFSKTQPLPVTSACAAHNILFLEQDSII